MSNWNLKLGLEIHVQIETKSKLFSRGRSIFGESANSSIAFLDIAMPGVLPVLNTVCIDKAIIVACVLNCSINNISYFDRKHYFYPDLPSGYQISQDRCPIATGGYVDIDKKRININHIHLEQDAGKSIHDIDAKYSYIDYNRSGIPLLEIVTEPDMSSVSDLMQFVKKIRAMLRYSGVSSCSMDKGNMRADVNVSIYNDNTVGDRVEIKNINSIRFMAQAVEYEIKRQQELLENGEQVKRETRLFDSKTCSTRSMRSKEFVADYCYMVDPDLPALKIEQSRIEKIKKDMPESFEKKIDKLANEYLLSDSDIKAIIYEPTHVWYYEECVEFFNKNYHKPDAKIMRQLYSLIMIDIIGNINHTSDHLNSINEYITPAQLSDILNLIEQEKISYGIAKEIIHQIVSQHITDMPSNMVQQQNLSQVTDENAIDQIARSVINTYQDETKKYRNGKTQLLGFFVGKVMQEMSRRADPAIVNKLLKAILDNENI